MSPARVAAPLAFLLLATIAILLIRSALNAEEPAAEPVITATQTFPTETTETETTTDTGETTEGELYVVQSGDTLESIAAAHDTTVEECERVDRNHTHDEHDDRDHRHQTCETCPRTDT